MKWLQRLAVALPACVLPSIVAIGGVNLCFLAETLAAWAKDEIADILARLAILFAPATQPSSLGAVAMDHWDRLEGSWIQSIAG